MKGVLGALKQRNVVALIGVVLLCLLIWFAGPYFVGHGLLEGAVPRLVTILIVVATWALVVQWRQWRASRASQTIAGGVAAQSDAPIVHSTGRAAAADSGGLRLKFTQALAELKKSGRNANLYDLPWFVIIGPPGAGKTTAFANCGLGFAGEGGAIGGIGGTRNCDWWLSKEAILLDTAGRYTTQDSDLAVDRAGWLEFLRLLLESRPRRAINGVLVAVSVSDLLTQSDEQCDAHARAIRQRLEELSHELRLTFPVYLLLTKVDLIAGFSECLGDMTREERAQVWGASFPLDVSRQGKAPAEVGPEFDALVRRLADRVLGRVQSERDARRRAAIFAFPEQLAGLRPRVVRLTQQIFSGEGLGERAWLRGVYLTSGTQQGTAIDRMVASLGRTFGIDVASVSASPLAGKSFFLERLMREVVVRESGLAGVSRRMERRHLLIQVSLCAACGLLTLLGLLALTVSYRTNRAYLQQVRQATAVLKKDAESSGTDLNSALVRMDRLRYVVDMAERFREHVPWSMRWGLYQGKSIGQAARSAYFLEMNGSLLPFAGQRLEQRVGGLAADPDRLYETFKAYLMLTDPQHVEHDALLQVARSEWTTLPSGVSGLSERLDHHFDALISDPQRMGKYPANSALITQARVSLKQASLPRLMYRRLVMNSAANTDGALHLDKELGLQSDRVYVRRGGKPLSDPIPALYTRAAFTDYLITGRVALSDQFIKDTWVFGPDAFDGVMVARVSGQVLSLYEKDYIRAWDDVLADLRIRATSTVADTADVLAILGSPSSPLRRLLELTEANTNLTKPIAAGTDPAAAAKAALAEKANQLGGVLGGAPATIPGQSVSQHFQALNALVEGSPAPIERTLASLSQAADKLRALESTVGQGGALSGVGSGAGSEVQRILAQEAGQLPPAVGDMLKDAGSASGAQVSSAARGELSDHYRDSVVRECRELIGGRYPFSRSSPNDAALADVGRVFGVSGTFDQFYTKELANLVDNTRPIWTWREGAQGIGAGAVPLAKFQAAQRVRDALFRPNSAMPEFQFTLAPEILDRQTKQFTLEIDGQMLKYSYGPQSSQPFVWPGKGAGVGVAAVTWEEEANGPSPNIKRDGPWAFFRLLDQAQIQPLGGLRYRITFALGGHSQSLILEAGSALNPLAQSAWRGFSCD